jgi:tetratricopeptide (TPR) repeat protein
VTRLRDLGAQEGSTRIAFRCSPYHTNSALYPVITHLEHILGFDQDDTPDAKLDKLEQVLRTTTLSLEVSVPHTASGLREPAVRYWQQAGQRAIQRSANFEAISHLTTGLDLLMLPPNTPERVRRELRMQTLLGQVWMDTKGMNAPEAGRAYARAHDLCRQSGETLHLVSVLVGLSTFHGIRGELQQARERAEEGLELGHEQQNTPAPLLAEIELGKILFLQGEFAPARHHLEQGIARYESDRYRTTVLDKSHLVQGLIFAAQALWYLGYPDQALRRSGDTNALAQELAHPRSLSYALGWAAVLHQLRREPQAVQAQIETARPLAMEHRFAQALAWQQVWEGWALAVQEHDETGLGRLSQGLEAWQATGAQPMPQTLALAGRSLLPRGSERGRTQDPDRDLDANRCNRTAVLRSRTISVEGRTASACQTRRAGCGVDPGRVFSHGA